MRSPAFVRLIGRQHLIGIKDKLEDGSSARVSPTDLCCIEVRHDNTNVVNLKDQTNLESSELGPNQTVLIKPIFDIKPLKYRTLVSINPDLILAGLQVTLAQQVVGKNELFLGIVVKSTKKFDLSTIDYMFKFYQID